MAAISKSNMAIADDFNTGLSVLHLNHLVTWPETCMFCHLIKIYTVSLSDGKTCPFHGYIAQAGHLKSNMATAGNSKTGLSVLYLNLDSLTQEMYI